MKKIVRKKWNTEATIALSAFQQKLKATENLTAAIAKEKLEKALEENNIKIGRVMQAVRLAITGVGAGPDLMNIIEIIGKEESIARIDQVMDRLSDKVKE